MEKVQIEFNRIGRDRLSWRQYLNEFDGENIIWAIKKQIPNADPDVWYNTEHTEGIVYADGIYPCGTFRRVA